VCIPVQDKLNYTPLFETAGVSNASLQCTYGLLADVSQFLNLLLIRKGGRLSLILIFIYSFNYLNSSMVAAHEIFKINA
jgi:hypothetical protein